MLLTSESLFLQLSTPAVNMRSIRYETCQHKKQTLQSFIQLSIHQLSESTHPALAARIERAYGCTGELHPSLLHYPTILYPVLPQAHQYGAISQQYR